MHDDETDDYLSLFCTPSPLGIEEDYFRFFSSKPKESFMSNLKNKYIIGSVTSSGVVSFSANPKEHTDQVAAFKEAERLARENPNKEFIVAKIVGQVTTQSVVWR